MKYLVCILLFSATAFGQQDSISKMLQGRVYSLDITPAPFDSVAEHNKDFIRSLQNHVPGPFIITVNNDPYTLTQADKDSIYKAAFNSPIVQEAIKAKFRGKNKLYEKGYELELLSLLKSDSISNDTKKRLLIGRILADWQYDEAHGRPNELGMYVNLYSDTTVYQNRDEAIEKFLLYHEGIKFSRILYVIDGKPYEAKDIKNLQLLLEKLKKVNIFYLELLTGSSATAIFGSRGINGVVIISIVN